VTAVEGVIVGAIERRRLIEFDYRRLHRVTEPHTLGFNTRGIKQLLAYQVGGQSHSGRLPEWRRFDVEGIADVAIRSTSFPQRPAPSGRHSQWSTIIAFVPAAS
jgi:hypothetical protein